MSGKRSEPQKYYSSVCQISSQPSKSNRSPGSQRPRGVFATWVIITKSKEKLLCSPAHRQTLSSRLSVGLDRVSRLLKRHLGPIVLHGPLARSAIILYSPALSTRCSRRCDQLRHPVATTCCTASSPPQLPHVFIIIIIIIIIHSFI